MKISLHYSHTFEQEFGGISRYLVELAKRISLSNHQIKIFSGIYKNNYLSELSFPLNEGIYSEGSSPQLHKLYGLISKKYKKVRNAIFKPEVFHLTHFSPYSFKPKNSIQVITMYDLISEIFFRDQNYYKQYFDMKQKSLSESQHIIAISHHTKKDIMEVFNINSDDISVIHLGVNKPIQNVVQLNKVKEDFILFVGRRGGPKNWENFLKAYSSSCLKNDFKIVAFGGGLPSSEDFEMIDRNCPGCVEFVSGDDKLLDLYYRSAKAFIYPSKYEGFGFPPLEAMMQSTPVFVSNVTSIPEIVGEAGFYFDPYDVDSIRDCLESNIYDAESIDLKVSLGLERVKNFTWEACADKTLALYESLI